MGVGAASSDLARLRAWEIPEGAFGSTRTRVLLAVLELSRPTVRSVALRAGVGVGTAHLHLTALRDGGLVGWDEGLKSTLHPLVEVVG